MAELGPRRERETLQAQVVERALALLDDVEPEEKEIEAQVAAPTIWPYARHLRLGPITRARLAWDSLKSVRQARHAPATLVTLLPVLIRTTRTFRFAGMGSYSGGTYIEEWKEEKGDHVSSGLYMWGIKEYYRAQSPTDYSASEEKMLWAHDLRLPLETATCEALLDLMDRNIDTDNPRLFNPPRSYQPY